MVKRTNFPFTHPFGAPLYQPPPHHYRDAHFIWVYYETKEEVLRDLLPEPVELRSNNVVAFILDARFSTWGSFLESGFWLQVQFRDYRGVMEKLQYLTTEAPLCGGREIYGMEKKLGQIRMTRHPQGVSGELERGGQKLMTLSTTLEQPGELGELPLGDGGLMLKLIPSPEEGKPPEVCELVFVPTAGGIAGAFKAKEFWKGTGSISFPERSEIDPVYKFEPVRIISGYYGIFDYSEPWGKVIYNYLSE